MARDDRVEEGARSTTALPDGKVAAGVQRFVRPRGDGFGAQEKRLFLVAVRKGKSVLASCRLVGISNRTAYNHRERDPEFARHWDLARQMARLPLELVAFERAVVGIAEPVYVHGRLSHTRRRLSDSLLRLLLQGEQPRKYGRAAGARTERKWLSRQIAAQVAAELDARAARQCPETPQTVNFVNPDCRGESAAIEGKNGAARLDGTPKMADFAIDREGRAAAVSPSRLRFSADLRSSCAASGAWAGSPPGNKGCAALRPPNNPGDSPRPATTRQAALSS